MQCTHFVGDCKWLTPLSGSNPSLAIIFLHCSINITNYNGQALQLTWDAAKESMRDIEMKTQIGRVAAQMDKFSFFFTGVKHSEHS